MTLTVETPTQESIFTVCPIDGLRGCTRQHGREPLSRDEVLAAAPRTLADVEREILHLEEQAQANTFEAVSKRLDIGDRLIAAQGMLPRNTSFKRWVEDRFPFSDRHARNFMDLARKRDQVLALPREVLVGGTFAAIKDALKQAEGPAPATEADPSLPEDCEIEELDAAQLARTAPWFGRVNLVVTSWPYALGMRERGYVDFTDYDAWKAATHRWARELYDVGAPNARYCVNVPLCTGYAGARFVASDAWSALEAAGLQLETVIDWPKAENGQASKSRARGSVDSPNQFHVLSSTEVIIVAFKGSWDRGRPGEPSDLGHEEWLAWSNAHWTFPGEYDKSYPCVFPRELPRRCIKAFSFPGDLVADFHVGRGTTAMAALAAGRRFVGGDVNPTAVRLARLNAATLLGQSCGSAETDCGHSVKKHYRGDGGDSHDSTACKVCGCRAFVARQGAQPR